MAHENEESFLQYLPPALWEHEEAPNDFLRRFLKIFQHLFYDLEGRVDDLPKLFNASTTPATFLPYLAAWAALYIDEDWSELQTRNVLRHIGELYRQRGTLEGLRRYLRLYVGSFVDVEELPPGNEDDIHGFNVIMQFPGYSHPELRRKARQVIALLDREKPAHTFYNLSILHPTLQIGVHSTIGVDTILGTTTTT